MKNSLGTALMLLGSLLILGALGLLVYNTHMDQKAAESSGELMPQLLEAIGENTQPPDSAHPAEPPTSAEKPPVSADMSETVIDGYGYIGYLQIPSLGLELPVMSQWDYQRLQKAPCRYYGSVDGGDLVIVAHNYSHHFKNISRLKYADTVAFTDVNGIRTAYQVVATDILTPAAVTVVTSGAYDLVLFTCTYGGSSRVVVYCDRTFEE